MQLEVGALLEGKVTGITKFGAFVALPEGKSGLVHISEVANTFVNDIHDYIQDGQTVKVKIIGVTPDGKINLSIKKAEERPAAAPDQYRRPPQQRAYREAPPQAEGPSGDPAFEDKLKAFMQMSDSKIADNKYYSDRRGGGRKRK